MTSATKAEERRIAWGYEPFTPHCGSCVGYRRPRVSLEAPPEQRLQRAKCSKGGFEVDAHGCCDKWSSRVTGERLKA